MAAPTDLLAMKSQNFEFLRAKRAVLADLGAFAEQYAYSDPSSSLIKQRTFVEQAVDAIYERYRLEPPRYGDSLHDLMNTEAFRQSVPDVVQGTLDGAGATQAGVVTIVRDYTKSTN